MKTNKIALNFALITFVTGTALNAFSETTLSNTASISGASFDEVQKVLESSIRSYTDDSSEKETIDNEHSVYESLKSSASLPAYKGIEAVYNSFNPLSWGQSFSLLFKASKRTLSTQVDYYDRIEKLVHSNGICFTGQWQIDESAANKYTGYFGSGKTGLFVGRASSAHKNTNFGQVRGFGFAGKIFPTLRSEEVVKTGNFFTVDVLPGQAQHYFKQTSLSNKPANDLLEHPSFSGLMINIATALAKAGGDPGFRPLYPITELASPGEVVKIETTKGPILMKLDFADKTVNKATSDDFRNELILSEGQTHVLEISVSDSLDQVKWIPIGKITLNKSYVSYGCDRRLHFPHPPLLK